jgi:TolB-like protein
VADYQAISTRLDSIEQSKYRRMAGFEDTTPAPVLAPPAAAGLINAAVYGLTGKGLGRSKAGINASAQMRTELVNTGVFRIMDRAEMEKILKEKGFKQKGACDDPACLAEVGRVLGVDRMLSGSVTNEGRVWTFSLSMIDAGTGDVLVTVTEHYDGWIKNDVVPQVTASLARQMADKVTNKAAAVNAETGVIGAPSAALEYDTSEAVPEGLAQVRLDPPTGTEGMKIVPRSGLVAININPSFTSLGLGFRTWSAGGFGFAAGGAVNWGSASGFSVKAQPMLALNAKSKSRVRWYLFPMIGYQWISIETESMDFGSYSTPSTSTDISLMNYVLGLGAEWRVGINRNHGLAAEVGYQGGEGTYETEPYTYMGMTIDPGGEQTYEPVPFYLMFSYAYYF